MVQEKEKKQKALLTSKLWLSLQLEHCLRQEVYSQRQKLCPPREKLLQKRRLNNSVVRSRPTSLTAEDFQQRNRDSQLYGKNQFYIRFQKTGMDHTLTVSPAMIRGEPIISISALKVPLCRQRFLRNCPLSFSHAGRMEEKKIPDGKKEVQMTSAHGNRIVIGTVCVCLITLVLMLGELLMERKLRMKLFEKKYSEAVSSLEMKNQEIKK